MKTLLFLIIIVFAPSLCKAQSFSEYVSTLPSIDIPLKFKHTYYRKWDSKELPKHLFGNSGINLSKNKGLGKIAYDEYYIILVREFHESDFYIQGLVYDKSGKFCSAKILDISADGDDVDFSITSDFKVKILNSGGITGILKTYVIENGVFRQLGEPVSIEDVDEYVQDN